MSNVIIGGLEIGQQQPTRVIGELGICHRGDIELAKEMSTYLAESGVDYIKYEIYQLDTVLTKPYRDKYEMEFGTVNDGMIKQNLFELIESGFLSYEEAEELNNHIKKLGVPFLATCTSIEEVDFMMSQGASSVKLSSGEVDNIPLVRYVGEKNIPVFMDIAKTYIWEVVRACEEYKSAGGENIVVMVNPPGYPTVPEKVDLKRIPAISSLLDVPVGYTCHTRGRNMILAAVGMGAAVIEKPVAPDNTLPYVEYAFAENMKEYKEFVQDVRDVDAAKGSPSRVWPEEEIKANLVNRHGLTANGDLKKGHQLRSEDIKVARPGFGIKSEYFNTAVGRELKRDLVDGEVIKWEDV
jgi:sialic acid synthase SpsE